MADSTLPVKIVPQIDEEALLGAVLAVISGHAVVKPGDTLIIRAPKGWNGEHVELYQEYLNARDLPFGVLVVVGDERGSEEEPRARLDVNVTGDAAGIAEGVGRAFARPPAMPGASGRRSLA